METIELQQRLKRLDSDKLMDVVKNYRQYGYTMEIRNYALTLLEERGISHSDLLLTGNLENKSYDFANDLLSSFSRNSKLAFLFYGLLLLIKAVGIWFNPETDFTNMALEIGFLLTTVLYFIFLIKSFLNQSDFYKATGEQFGFDGALVYLLFGLPFYFVMYFVFQNQMKERMKTVH
jgi:lipopolysaccharide export system permease protein